jgi:chromate reductase
VKQPKIFSLVGGICKDSLSRKLFEFFKEEAGDNFSFNQFAIETLPYFSQDVEHNPPQEVVDFKKKADAADAVLIVTPEYNRSFPGVLKNALDWGSRPYGKSVWPGKPAGLIGTSPGAIGAFGAQSQMKLVLSFLDFRLMNQPEFYFTFPKELEGGKLPASAQDFLRLYVSKFRDWVTNHINK